MVDNRRAMTLDLRVMFHDPQSINEDAARKALDAGLEGAARMLGASSFDYRILEETVAQDPALCPGSCETDADWLVE
jgi:hypothetical protein